MQDIGAILRERRESLGLNLADVEAGIRIRQKYLAALESDEWHQLPGEVVGRGFLRNYARFLELDPESLMENRRGSVDPHLQQALESTSAGAPMPAARDVDYRPRDVALTREPLIDFDDIVIDWRKVTPFLSLILLVLLLAGGWWGIRQLAPRLGTAFGGMVDTVQTQVAELRPGDEAPATPDGVQAATISTDPVVADLPATATPAESGAAIVPTFTPEPVLPTPTPVPPTPTDAPPTVENPAADPVVVEPVVEQPTEQPAVQPVEDPAVEEPVAEEVIAPTPAPEFPPPLCADERTVILSPGVNQVVQGQVTIVGTVFHDDFWYYKLEFAPGANAREGFVYFAGAENQIQSGTLARLNSAALGNGTYTIKLTVVDNTGNFPAPCQVTIQVAN